MIAVTRAPYKNRDHPRIILIRAPRGKLNNYHPSVIPIWRLGARIRNCGILRGTAIILHIILRSSWHHPNLVSDSAGRFVGYSGAAVLPYMWAIVGPHWVSFGPMLGPGAPLLPHWWAIVGFLPPEARPAVSGQAPAKLATYLFK